MSTFTYICEQSGYLSSALRMSPPSLLLADSWADIPDPLSSPLSIVQRPEADEDPLHHAWDSFPNGLSLISPSEVRYVYPFPMISEVDDESTPHPPRDLTLVSAQVKQSTIM